MSTQTRDEPGVFSGLLRWLALLTLLATLVALGLALYGALGFKYGMLPLGEALLGYFRVAVVMFMGTAAVGALLTVILVFRSYKGGLISAILAAGVSLVVVGLVGPQVQTGRAVPPIHDISTDTQTPPAFQAILPVRAEWCAQQHIVDSGGCNPSDYVRNPDYLPGFLGQETAPPISDLQAEAYPEIRPLTFLEDREAVFDRALAAAEGLGWTIVAAEREEGRIEASDTSFWFGFVDDVVIRIDEGATSTILDIRSQSRIGRSDVGVNARRITAFKERLVP